MADQSPDMTWADYVALLRRRWRPLVLTTALIALGSIFVAYTLPAQYLSTTLIMIDQQDLPAEYIQPVVNSYLDERLQTIHQRVVSRPNVAMLINELGLYPDERGEVPEDELIDHFRDDTTLAPQFITTVHPTTGRELTVNYAFRSSFLYEDPEKARDVVARLAELYVAENERLRSEATGRATDFLEQQIGTAQRELDDVTEQITRFREREVGNLPDNQDDNRSTAERLRQELQDIERDLRLERQERELLGTELAVTPQYRPVLDESGEQMLGAVERLQEAQQELIQAQGRGLSDGHPEIRRLKNEIARLSADPRNLASQVENLEAQLAATRQELSATLRTYTPQSPQVQALERQIAGINEQLAAARRSLSASGGSMTPNNPDYLNLQTRMRTADAAIAGMERRRNEIRNEIDDLDRLRGLAPEVEREYNNLLQEQDRLRGELDEMRRLRADARLAENLEAGGSGEKLTVIEPPRVPSSPESPDRLMLSFVGVLIAVALGLGIASLIDATDTTVRAQRDVLELLDMPPMGIIPYVESPADRARRIGTNAAIGTGIAAGTALVIFTVLTA